MILSINDLRIKAGVSFFFFYHGLYVSVSFKNTIKSVKGTRVKQSEVDWQKKNFQKLFSGEFLLENACWKYP